MLWPQTSSSHAWPPGNLLAWPSTGGSSYTIPDAESPARPKPSEPAAQAAGAGAAPPAPSQGLGLSDYLIRHGLQDALNVALNSVAQACPAEPWRAIAATLPKDAPPAASATTPAVADVVLLGSLQREWRARHAA